MAPGDSGNEVGSKSLLLVWNVSPDQEEPWRRFLQELSDSRHVLIRRYGFDDQGSSTLAVLSNELEVSRERVRQLQREAEHMLKKQVLTKGEA